MRRLISFVAALIVTAPCLARAQDRSTSAFDDSIRSVKSALLDPTTYAPAILSYGSQRLDWDSSQVFFRHGSTEHNPNFTTTGRPDDLPIGYGAGNRKILRESLLVFQASLVNNVADHLIETALLRRYPRHRKLIRVVGWAERIGVASYFGYQTSVLHFEQWQRNRDTAARLGY